MIPVSATEPGVSNGMHPIATINANSSGDSSSFMEIKLGGAAGGGWRIPARQSRLALPLPVLPIRCRLWIPHSAQKVVAHELVG